MSTTILAPTTGRREIYYWKCDRPAAFHVSHSRNHQDWESALHSVLVKHFPGKEIHLTPAAGQGNHLTALATIGGCKAFIRMEDGPEQDEYLEVESTVMDRVRDVGVPVPQVLAVDTRRQRVPFAWQALERVDHPDLNHWSKQGRLQWDGVAFAIGANMARWQSIEPVGYGPFDLGQLRETDSLVGYHDSYADYFDLNLERHLRFLVERSFFTSGDVDYVMRAISSHRSLLQLDQGCLVHKDLALWNILGSHNRVEAFIDWDDAISGDPMDDVSLLGCFHAGDILGRVLEGYASKRPLPADHRRRFWLHLLRNMIVKAVIRVGSGYFERSDSFFLIGSGASGGDLRQFTYNRIREAVQGLQEDREITDL